MKVHWREQKGEVLREGFRGKTAILIPFRNEAEHLPGLLINLEKILPDSQEVLFIDDASTDGSARRVASFIRDRKNNHWVLLENAGKGKKAALTTGVNFTQANIILTTDADCLLPDHWVDHMTQAFYNHDTQLAAGPVVTVAQAGFFRGFQQIEWAGILLMTKYLFSRNSPLMCSGANLAYRRAAFVAVEGYRENDMHLSGDDEFLLKKIIQKYGRKSVTYIQDGEALVKTVPQPTWAAFIQQRVRWASKWRLHRSGGHALSAVLAFALAFIEISTVLLLIGSVGPWLVFFVFWTVKVGMEKNVLGKVLGDYGMRQSLSCFIRTSFLHPAYVILVGIRAISGKYSWKGRKNQSRF